MRFAQSSVHRRFYSKVVRLTSYVRPNNSVHFPKRRLQSVSSFICANRHLDMVLILLVPFQLALIADEMGLGKAVH